MIRGDRYQRNLAKLRVENERHSRIVGVERGSLGNNIVLPEHRPHSHGKLYHPGARRRSAAVVTMWKGDTEIVCQEQIDHFFGKGTALAKGASRVLTSIGEELTERESRWDAIDPDRHTRHR